MEDVGDTLATQNHPSCGTTTSSGTVPTGYRSRVR